MNQSDLVQMVSDLGVRVRCDIDDLINTVYWLQSITSSIETEGFTLADSGKGILQKRLNGIKSVLIDIKTAGEISARLNNLAPSESGAQSQGD